MIISDLIRRLEAATGPDRALDGAKVPTCVRCDEHRIKGHSNVE